MKPFRRCIWQMTLVSTAASYVIFSYLTVNVPLVREMEEKEEMRFRIRGPLYSNDTRLVELVKTSYLLPPSKEPYNLSTRNKDSRYERFSHRDTWPIINVYVKGFFSEEPPGFFVEAGALDGEFLSNTLWLEQKLGWTGLLVEPDKDTFRYLQSKHRRSWTSNTCLSNQFYPKETVFVSHRLRKDSVLPYSPWNHRGSSYEQGIEILPKNHPFQLAGDSSYSIVQCFPLNTFLQALNISTVDFLSLDIQGSEKDVLRNIRWDSTKIRVMVVEVVEEKLDESFANYIESKGYVLVNRNLLPVQGNHVYVRKDEELLLAKYNATIIQI